MVKITLNIEGMACGMCEAHVNEAIRKAFPVKKVTSSCKKGKTEIVAEALVDSESLKKVIETTGYKVTGINSEPYEKKGFSLFRK